MDSMRIDLDNSNCAPATARQALQSWLVNIDSAAPVLDDALLVVSELVTNAVTHTDGDSMVIAAFDDHRLRIEVHDRDPRGPVAATGADAGGYGLPILEALCDLWGWEPIAFGKRVWTETLC